MKLFKYENYELKIAEEAYAIPAFKKIVNADRTVGKTNAMNIFSFIYFVYDPRSEYQYITNEEDRIAKVEELLNVKIDIKKADTANAIATYKELVITTSFLLLESSRKAVDRLRSFLSNIDLTEEINGKPKYTVNSITGALKSIPSIIKDLRKAEEACFAEIEENDKIRGDKNKTLLDDGFEGFM